MATARVGKTMVLLIVLSLLACSKNDSEGRSSSDLKDPRTSPSEFVGEGSVADDVKEAVGLGPSIPDLKPIAKGPFPDGATEEQVCEAIDDTDEKDLWVRFGHLVPLYEPSTVFILAVHGKTAEDVFDYVMRKYKGGGRYGPMVKVCKKLDKALLYIRYMFDDAVLNGLLTGRQDLAKHMKDELGVETLESYFFEARQNAKRDRLAEYCRKDAYVCDKLTTLLTGEPRDLLCSHGLIISQIRVTADEESALKHKCMGLSSPPLACAMFAKTPTDERTCAELVRRRLGRKE